MREVLFERIVTGNVARVAAIDPVTGTEAIVMGPASAPPSDLETLAVRKLERLLQPPPETPAPPRRGRLV